MNKKKLSLIAVVFILLLSACARNEASPSASNDAVGYGAESALVVPQESPASKGLATNTERIVIENASISLYVPNPGESVKDAGQLAKAMGGFVVSSSIFENKYANIVIRVPASRLDEALEKIRQMAPTGKDGIISESKSGQDVTSDYVDSQSRLRNLQSAEAQLVELLNNSKDLQGTIDIFRELTSTREQIEVLQGHIKYLEESAALSAIDIQFRPEASMQPIEIGGWKPAGVARDAIQTLVDILQTLGDFLIRFSITCLPFLIPLGVGIYFLVRAIRKNKSKKQSPYSETHKPSEFLKEPETEDDSNT